MVNSPSYGEISSAFFHSSLAFSGLNSRTSLPASESEWPGMTGEVKSVAGVRVP